MLRKRCRNLRIFRAVAAIAAIGQVGLIVVEGFRWPWALTAALLVSQVWLFTHFLHQSQTWSGAADTAPRDGSEPSDSAHPCTPPNN